MDLERWALGALALVLAMASLLDRSFLITLVLVPVLIYLADLLEADALVLGMWNNGVERFLMPDLYRFPLRRKANMNVLVVGTSGKGKTNLLDLLVSKYFRRFAVLSFKEGDLHLGLNASVVDVSLFAPFDRRNFVDAFMLTFQPRVVGEVVSRYAGILWGMVAKSSDWPTLMKNVEEAVREERDRINRTTLISLREKLLLLLPGGSGDVPVLERVVYDLSGLNEYQKSFFAELILRKFSKAEDMALVVDEAYNVFRRTEHHTSVLERLLREGRSRNLAVLVATQSLLDLPEEVVPQFDTIFVFSTSGEDLRILRSMGIPQELVSGLGNYECVDVRDRELRILRFRRFRPAKPEVPRPEVRLTEEGVLVGERFLLSLRDGKGVWEVELLDKTTGERFGPVHIRRISEVEETVIWSVLRAHLGSQAGEVLERVGELDLRRKVDYGSEILELLAENGIMSLSSIARALAERHGLDLSRTKLACLTYLKRLCERGQVLRTEVVNEFGRKTVYYELPSASESELHKLLVDRIFVMARKLGLPVERRSDVDLAVGDVGIEVETGRKDRRPARREGFREVWVVVPNEEVGRRYDEAMTLRDLYLRLRSMSGGEKVEEKTGRKVERKGRKPERSEKGEVAEAAVRYVKRSMMAYLDGKKNLNWIVGVIRSSGLRGELLERVFKELESYGNRDLLEKAREACRRKRFL